jgi:hypothetical protein
MGVNPHGGDDMIMGPGNLDGFQRSRKVNTDNHQAQDMFFFGPVDDLIKVTIIDLVIDMGMGIK